MNVFSVAGRFVSSLRCIALLLLFAVVMPLSAFSASEKLVDSDEYKDKDFRKGCLSDYKDLTKGDQIDWAWLSPGVKLGDYSLTIAKFENKTDDIRSAQLEDIKSVFKEILGKLKGGKGTLSANFCVFEVQKFSPGKAWIPFAGGHQMQAGIGVEVTLSDKGATVAKIRHFARNGSRLEDAADETANDLKKYISKH
jgi:hypothetical protein